MATKKDLVEAHSFSRRRLVTAFLSGAPGGREVEPSRPGRTIVGGIALSVLLIAGAAIASVLASRTPADWDKAGLILSRENAALYVILAKEDPPVLHPVINATSAQLIFGANAEATIVARETVDQQTPGTTIGIFGAPQTLPTTSDLVQSGWTACTGDELGMKVNIDRARLTSPSVPEQAQPTAAQQPAAGFVVRTVDDDKTYLIATGRLGEAGQRARSYEIPDDTLDGALDELGLPPTRDALDVPSDWLRLFEPGKPLTWDSFGIADPGGELPAALAQAAPGARIGDYVPATDSDEAKVLTAQGPLSLDPFSAAIYSEITVPTTGGAPRPLPVDTALSQLGFASESTLDATGWPDATLTQPPGQACAVLTPTPGDRPSVQLAVDPRGEASAADVADPLDREVRVEPGTGAYVWSGSFEDSTSETPFVIDAKGDIYPLLDEQTIFELGYSGVDVTVVPDTWIELFDEGVTLSTSAALCPPDPTGAATDQACETYSGTDTAAGGS